MGDKKESRQVKLSETRSVMLKLKEKSSLLVNQKKKSNTNIKVEYEERACKYFFLALFWLIAS